MTKLTLISFPTCPYVQRAVIALKEKQVDFDVVYIDLANKPDWFLAISPLGKVPVLKVEREGHEPAIVFESAVILEYLEETAAGVKLHPEDALERAQHRSWIEFGSQVLGDLWRISNAKDNGELDAARQALTGKLTRLETIVVGPFFAGERFSAVDAVFAPAFRQIDALESAVDAGLTRDLPKISAWRQALAARPSVRDAAPADFADQYLKRLRNNDAHILKLAA
ncbi:MAG TPA: glutathione S-transferase family protein [Devosia sp.]|nr:glutathione S-transferase family protein [Devosia sp.]